MLILGYALFTQTTKVKTNPRPRPKNIQNNRKSKTKEFITIDKSNFSFKKNNKRLLLNNKPKTQ
jgi:hypothetical protein